MMLLLKPRHMLSKRFILAFSACGVLVIFINIATFVYWFPGVRRVTASQTIVTPSTLPEQRELYRPPVAPVFLSKVSTRHAYVSLEKPFQLPLVRYHADDQSSLASLTKLTTALVALSFEPDWTKMVTIEPTDRRSGAQQHIYAGEELTMQDLWTLMLVGSDNDAVVAFIRGLGVSEEVFVEKMNEKAKSLHLSSTTFVEPTGLSSYNVSTAREYAVVARLAFAESRISKELARADATILANNKPRRIFSTDQELKGTLSTPRVWQFVTGKTGFIEESGYNVALLASDEKGEQFLAVVLGSASISARASETSLLLEWAVETVQTMPEGAVIDNRLLY